MVCPPVERSRWSAEVAGSSRRCCGLLRRGGRIAARQGVITLWTVLCIPFIMTILFVVAEVSQLWQARAQLENALEAAALAAVQEWGDAGGGIKNIAAAQTAGRAYAKANLVHGIQVDLDDQSVVPAVAWSFGSAEPNGSGFDFTVSPDAKAKFAVVLHATVKVARLSKSILGPAAKDSTVTVKIAAFYDPSATSPQPRLIRLNESSSP